MKSPIVSTTMFNICSHSHRNQNSEPMHFDLLFTAQSNSYQERSNVISLVALEL
jgi:hypothetical protein